MLAAFFVTEFDPAKVTKPCQSALDDVTRSAQPAAMRLVFRRQHGDHAAAGTADLIGQAAVGAVSHQFPGPQSWPSPATVQRGQMIEKRNGHGTVRNIGRCGSHDQRHAIAIREEVPLTAFFCSVRGIGSGVRPPKSARTLALSMTPRERSNWPRCPKIFRSLACTLGQ